VLESIALICAKTLDKKGILLLGNEDKVMRGRGIKKGRYTKSTQEALHVLPKMRKEK